MSRTRNVQPSANPPKGIHHVLCLRKNKRRPGSVTVLWLSLIAETVLVDEWTGTREVAAIVVICTLSACSESVVGTARSTSLGIPAGWDAVAVTAVAGIRVPCCDLDLQAALSLLIV